MREQRGFTGSQIALAFLGGAAAGAAVALLTAPKSGRETREQLNGYLRRGKARGEELPEAMRSAASAAKEAYDAEVVDARAG